ncbi:MAG: recombinase XerD, partial [Pseudomonadota bacterium]|nr:recombinase XerD [Pseudomonadota bacterium]
MLASERGAARNTLLAYGRDLEQAEELIGTGLEAASAAQLAKLGQEWSALAPA